MPNTSLPIDKAAKAGHFEDVKKQIEEGVSFSKEHLFDCAVQDYRTIRRNQGHNQILKYLYNLGMTPLSRVGWMDQPILCACAMYGNVELIEHIVSKNKPDDIFSNAAIGNIDFFLDPENLLKVEAALDQNGFNPLHYCAASSIGNVISGKKKELSEISKMLVAKGVNPKLVVKNKIDLYPAFLCSWFGGNEDILDILLQQGITQEEIGVGCIEFALEPHQRSGEPYYLIAERFLRSDWDINFKKSHEDRTLLHGAANRGSLKPTKWLLDHDADPNAIDGNGKTPLHVAAERNTTTGVIELLLNYGADINKVDSNGKTAIFYAIQNKRTKVVSYLESKGREG